MAPQDTKTKLLNEAQLLLQTRGYHGFSFHDLTDRVGIITASIHYHFPTKLHLVLAVVNRYLDGFWQFIGDPGDGVAEVKLSRFVDAFRQTMKSGRSCLCGVLGAEADGIPPEVAALIREFFDRSRAWVARVLQTAGQPAPAAKTRAALLVAAMEGLMLLARSGGGVKLLDETAQTALQLCLARVPAAKTARSPRKKKSAKF